MAKLFLISLKSSKFMFHLLVSSSKVLKCTSDEIVHYETYNIIPDVEINSLESLEHDGVEDDESDGQSVNLLVYFIGRVDPGDVVFVHAVFQYEEQQPCTNKCVVVDKFKLDDNFKYRRE